MSQRRSLEAQGSILIEDDEDDEDLAPLTALVPSTALSARKPPQPSAPLRKGDTKRGKTAAKTSEKEKEKEQQKEKAKEQKAKEQQKKKAEEQQKKKAERKAASEDQKQAKAEQKQVRREQKEAKHEHKQLKRERTPGGREVVVDLREESPKKAKMQALSITASAQDQNPPSARPPPAMQDCAPAPPPAALHVANQSIVGLADGDEASASAPPAFHANTPQELQGRPQATGWTRRWREALQSFRERKEGNSRIPPPQEGRHLPRQSKGKGGQKGKGGHKGKGLSKDQNVDRFLLDVVRRAVSIHQNVQGRSHHGQVDDVAGGADLPSMGSALHARGLCHPCAFFWKPIGCKYGKDCRFCHLCPEGEIKARRKRTAAFLHRGAQATVEVRSQLPAERAQPTLEEVDSTTEFTEDEQSRILMAMESRTLTSSEEATAKIPKKLLQVLGDILQQRSARTSQPTEEEQESQLAACMDALGASSSLAAPPAPSEPAAEQRDHASTASSSPTPPAPDLPEESDIEEQQSQSVGHEEQQVEQEQRLSSPEPSASQLLLALEQQAFASAPVLQPEPQLALEVANKAPLGDVVPQPWEVEAFHQNFDELLGHLFETTPSDEDLASGTDMVHASHDPVVAPSAEDLERRLAALGE